jgi:hypothetical protein
MSWYHALIPGRRKLVEQLRLERSIYENRLSTITAAKGRGGGGRGGWMGMPEDEDAANKEYATDRYTVMQRAQDLDVNNADVGGFNRFRVGQILGAGVSFKHTPIASEIGLTEKQATDVGQQVDRLRRKHSENGGFDSQKGQAWEGTRQAQAMLTAIVFGSCIIHRVWRTPRSPGTLPLSIELIAGSRISTPYDKRGDPLVSHGVRYSDDHRTRVVGYYVRRVSKTVGNSFIPDVNWDFLPIEDCSVLELTEIAGIDQSLPLCTRNTQTLRNRGEFIENMVESARAQSNHYGVTECAPGESAYDVASDDRSQSNTSYPNGFVDLGGGVRMLYTPNGQKVTWSSAKLPEPELQQFLNATDERLSRGFVASKSAFTRVVNNSYAGGRLEEQQDDPIIAQYRILLRAAWHKVNGWFLEAVWLTSALELPGYSGANQHLWNEFRAEFPGKVDINPQDTAGASEKNLMIRKTNPLIEIERTGADPRSVVRGWADWTKLVRDEEARANLPEGSLDVLFSGKAITTSAGDDVQPAAGATADEPGSDPKSPDPKEPGGAAATQKPVAAGRKAKKRDGA